jgi:hypothetical protein
VAVVEEMNTEVAEEQEELVQPMQVTQVHQQLLIQV